MSVSGISHCPHVRAVGLLCIHPTMMGKTSGMMAWTWMRPWSGSTVWRTVRRVPVKTGLVRELSGVRIGPGKGRRLMRTGPGCRMEWLSCNARGLASCATGLCLCLVHTLRASRRSRFRCGLPLKRGLSGVRSHAFCRKHAFPAHELTGEVHRHLLIPFWHNHPVRCLPPHLPHDPANLLSTPGWRAGASSILPASCLLLGSSFIYISYKYCAGP